MPSARKFAGIGAVTSPVNRVPAEVAVGSVAVAAESGIVVVPGQVNLSETQRRPQCPGDLSGVDGAPWLFPAVGPLVMRCHCPGLCFRRMPAWMKLGGLPTRQACAWATISTRAETSEQTAHIEVTTTGLAR